MNFQQARGVLPLFGLATALCLGFAGAAQADNTLTEAGSTVSNTFELRYSVSGTTQPIITNDDVSPPAGAVTQGSPTLFTVDRKVDFVVTATNSILSTPPGANATLTFELLNEGNDTSSYSFSTADFDSGPGTFDASSVLVRYSIDANDDGVDNDGTYVTVAETAIGAAPGSAFVTGDVPKGVLVFLQVQGTVATSVADNSTDQITLVAEARDPTTFLNEASTPAAVTAADGGANLLENDAQNVLADGEGVVGTDTDADGLFAANGIIEVESPDLLAGKTVLVIEEPDASGSVSDCATATAVSDAKAVPGACVEYVIEVENTGDTASAANLVIDDILPAEVNFVAASLVAVSANGFVDDPAIAATTGPVLDFPTTTPDSLCNGTTTCVIQLSDALLAAGETGRIVIRAEIK